MFHYVHRKIVYFFVLVMDTFIALMVENKMLKINFHLFMCPLSLNMPDGPQTAHTIYIETENISKIAIYSSNMLL